MRKRERRREKKIVLLGDVIFAMSEASLSVMYRRVFFIVEMILANFLFLGVKKSRAIFVYWPGSMSVGDDLVIWCPALVGPYLPVFFHHLPPCNDEDKNKIRTMPGSVFISIKFHLTNRMTY